MFKFKFVIFVISRPYNKVRRQNVPNPDTSLEEGVLPIVYGCGWGSILLVMAVSGCVSN